ncbi:KRAB-A domain-containing protein 2-like, partial [Homalodisca vitripennis]|uniref:KRAB-A domain-containing protein 2-like n=1 Tax=Homalodisca vitripennis TaxID=197043 RepID=UPI001EEADB8C
YQDHLTKFVVLRPLKTKTADEVSDILLDIFCLFGAPYILHSDNGREFCNRVIENLASKWSAIKLVHGKPRHSQSQGSVVERANQDVRDSLVAWMTDNNTSGWANGLRIIQNVTVVACFSATGIYVPPAMIFPRKRMKPELYVEAPVGTLPLISDSGYMNLNIFIDWLKHFARHTKPTEDDPVLLLLDNHSTHTGCLESDKEPLRKQNGPNMIYKQL